MPGHKKEQRKHTHTHTYIVILVVGPTWIGFGFGFCFSNECSLNSITFHSNFFCFCLFSVFMCVCVCECVSGIVWRSVITLKNSFDGSHCHDMCVCNKSFDMYNFGAGTANAQPKLYLIDTSAVCLSSSCLAVPVAGRKCICVPLAPA